MGARARDAMVDHLMGCNVCCAPKHQYCEQGAELRRAYLQAHHNATTPE